MSEWAQGYVSDIEYTSQFFRDQAPGLIAFTCLLNSAAPPRTEGAFEYCELGCGNGLTLNVLAAANPRARFVGIDFNPAHIVAARRMAARAGLENVTFLEASFEEALADAHRLPDFDFVTLHGVYSWVGPAIRQQIVTFLRRKIVPGGAAYVSYNTMPGWAQSAPIQRLLRDVALSVDEKSDQAILRAIRFVEELNGVGAISLKDNPYIADLVEMAKNGFHRYLAHEHLNADWDALYFSDVAREMGEAKLQYVGRANAINSFSDLMFTGEQRALLERIASPALRRQVEDYIHGSRFRADIYVRGARALTGAERTAALRDLHLAMVMPRDGLQLTFRVPTGEASLNPDTYETAFELLRGAPKRVADVMDGLERHFAPRPVPVSVVELTGILTGLRICSPAVAALDSAAIARCFALNRFLAADSAQHVVAGHVAALAAPAIGSGLLLERMQVDIFEGIASGVPPTVPALSARIWQPIRDRGENLIHDGKPVTSEAESLALIGETVEAVLTKRVPVWRSLGILPG